MARMNSENYSISLAAMLSSLSLLFLYLAVILPTMKLSMYAIASLFTMPLCIEKRTFYAFMVFVSTSLLSLFILPNFINAIPYYLFFGHYGILKYHAECIEDKVLAMVIKLAYFNIIAVLMYLFFKNLLLDSIPDFLKNSAWVLLVVGQIVFVAYDFIYSKFAEMYVLRLRPYLIRRGRR